MLFEVYYSADDLAARQSALFAPIQRITVGGLLAMLVIATPIIWVLTRRLTRTGRERERLLRASMTASRPSAVASRATSTTASSRTWPVRRSR